MAGVINSGMKQSPVKTFVMGHVGDRIRTGLIRIGLDPRFSSYESGIKAPIGHCEALIVCDRTNVTAELIEAAKNIKIIGKVGNGYVDIDAATEKEIVVVDAIAKAPDEQILAQMFDIAHDIVRHFKGEPVSNAVNDIPANRPYPTVTSLQENIDQLLMIPGPTTVPSNVLAAMSKPMINHRGPKFKEIFEEVIDGVKWACRTTNDVLMTTSSGTGGMEAAVVNFLSPGDKVVVLNIGAFGSRLVKIAKAYGADVIEIRSERGKAADTEKLKEILAGDKKKEIKAVLFQHNETSTGVLNDVQKIASIIKKHGALVIVDAVSGLLTAPLKTDEWGLDVVVSGSQKAFMVPPGLAFVSVSAKAWEAREAAKMPRFYFDLVSAKEFAEKGQTPWTPAISVVYAMQESIKMLKAEGLDNIFARHEKMQKIARTGLEALGFKLLAKDDVASKAITAVLPPEGMDAEEIRAFVRENFSVVLAGGQEELKGKVFRIGHLGYINDIDVIEAIAALKAALTYFQRKK